MDTDVVPLVYLKDGRVVRAGPGGRWMPAAKDDGVAAVAKVADGAKHVYVFDLDGQTSGVPNLPLLQALEKRQVFPWVDAAPRTADDAMDLVFAGAEALTLQPRRLDRAAQEDFASMAEAEIHVAYATGRNGLEGALRPREVAQEAKALQAVGVVLYETPTSDLHRASDVAVELARAGLRVSWVARPASPQADAAVSSGRFHLVARPQEAT